jgi:hypothetical protein
MAARLETSTWKSGAPSSTGIVSSRLAAGLRNASFASIRSWRSPASPTLAVETPLRLTLIILLLRPMGPWYVRSFLLLLATLGLIAPAVLRAPATWLALALLVGARIFADWPLPDNHIYLLAYWCLAAALSLRDATPSVAIARSSRLLIGLAFLCAVLWKTVLSSDYVDGRFFRVTLLTDDRFADVARLAGGLGEADLAENRAYLTPLPEGAELLDPPALHEPRGLRWLAQIATWGGLTLEAIVAAMFLLPRPGRLMSQCSHASVVLFCMATYALAPVAGFGWLLLAMGLASTERKECAWRRTYVTAFLLVMLYAEIPWSAMLVGPLESRIALPVFRGISHMP